VDVRRLEVILLNIFICICVLCLVTFKKGQGSLVNCWSTIKTRPIPLKEIWGTGVLCYTPKAHICVYRIYFPRNSPFSHMSWVWQIPRLSNSYIWALKAHLNIWYSILILVKFRTSLFYSLALTSLHKHNIALILSLHRWHD